MIAAPVLFQVWVTSVGRCWVSSGEQRSRGSLYASDWVVEHRG
jgi:hypothetical protein